MALQLSHTTASDVTCASAYHRITFFSGGSSDDPVQVHLAVFKDQEARQAGKQPVDAVRVTVQIDMAQDGNIMANLYAAVRATEAYADAVNC